MEESYIDPDSQEEVPLNRERMQGEHEQPPGSSPYDTSSRQDKERPDESVNEGRPQRPRNKLFTKKPGLWSVFTLGSLGLFGFISGLFLQNSSTTPAMVQGGASQIEKLFLPNSDGIPMKGVLKLISQAQKEIIVAAQKANSTQFLGALAEMHHKGVQVIIILDEDTNKTNPSAYNFLLSKRVPADNIFLYPKLNSQFIVIDSSKTVVGNMPFNNTGQREGGEAVYMDNPAIANDFRKHAQSLARSASSRQ